MAVLTEAEVPERNKKRNVAAKTLKKKRKALSSEKACKILRDGKVHGAPLTKKQRAFFGAKCDE